MAPSVLASVECSVLRADPRLAGLPHVADQLSSLLLDRSLALLPKAATYGSVALFDRLAARVQGESSHRPEIYAFWFGRALETAIRHDNLLIIQRIHCLHPQPLDVRSLTLALQFGALETVQWIIENRSDRLCCSPGIHNLCASCLYHAIPESSMRDACRIIPWLFESGFTFGLCSEDPNPSAAVALAEIMRGDAELVMWLEANGHLREKQVKAFLRHAMESGPPEAASAVQALLQKGYTLKEVEAVDSLLLGCCHPELEPVLDVVASSQLGESLRDKFTYAPIREGGRKVLQWSKAFLESHGRNRPNNAKAKLRQNALRFGHVDLARWLVRERGITPVASLSPDCSEEAALHQYEAMEELGIPVAKHDGQLAAAQGFLEVLRRLPVDNDPSRLMIAAAANGHLNVVQWINQEFPGACTSNAVEEAAGNGHLHVVQWLLTSSHEDICTDKALVQAAKHGHLPVVQSLAQQQPEGDTTEAMAEAAIHGHLDILEWLHDNCARGCLDSVIGRVMHSAETVSPQLALRWLRSQIAQLPLSSALSTDASFGSVMIAADAGDLHCLQNFDEPTMAMTAQRVAEIAARRGHVGVLRWLFASNSAAIDWEKVRSTSHRASVCWLNLTNPQLL